RVLVEQPANAAQAQSGFRRHEVHAEPRAARAQSARVSKTESVIATSTITAPIAQNPGSISSSAICLNRLIDATAPRTNTSVMLQTLTEPRSCDTSAIALGTRPTCSG